MSKGSWTVANPEVDQKRPLSLHEHTTPSSHKGLIVMTLDEDAALADFLRETRKSTQADVDKYAEDHPALVRYETHGPSAPTGSAH